MAEGSLIWRTSSGLKVTCEGEKMFGDSAALVRHNIAQKRTLWQTDATLELDLQTNEDVGNGGFPNATFQIRKFTLNAVPVRSYWTQQSQPRACHAILPTEFEQEHMLRITPRLTSVIRHTSIQTPLIPTT
jgi:hypothetical protein